jgi:hypothetical protein
MIALEAVSIAVLGVISGFFVIPLPEKAIKKCLFFRNRTLFNIFFVPIICAIFLGAPILLFKLLYTGIYFGLFKLSYLLGMALGAMRTRYINKRDKVH